jgi:hypothetical protein
MSASLTVFVCSTFADLSSERESVLDAIRRLKLQHDSMEFFGARTQQPLETCLEEVRRSDILVVIVGHRYGSIAPEVGISFSEAEYREGFRLGKPCLIYMRDDDVPILPKHMERDPASLMLLEKWKAVLRERHTVAAFLDGQRLAVQVAADLGRTLQDLQKAAEARSAAEVGGEQVMSEIADLASGAIERGIPESSVLSAIRAAIMSLAASKSYQANVFASYARADQVFVMAIADELAKFGINVWLDDRKLDPGAQWVREIERALSSADVVLFFISPSSVKSSWALQEVQIALHRQVSGEGGGVLLPILLEEAEVPPLLRTIQFLDMRDRDIKKGVQRLVETIHRLSARRGAA